MTMRKKPYVCCVILLFVATSAIAEIFKCVAEDGTLRFSDQPCGAQATVVVPKTDYTVDEAIGTGSPFAGPVKYTDTIGQDIVMHAKRIGNSMFPDDQLKASDIMIKYKYRSPFWTVVLYYVDRKQEFKDTRVELDYQGKLEGAKITLRLSYIRMKRFDWATTPTTIQKAKKLKRDNHYGWHVIASPL